MTSHTALSDFVLLLFSCHFTLQITHNVIVKVYAPRSMMTYYDEFYALMGEGSEECEQLLASEHIDVLLDMSRDQKFDVLITEFFNSDCTLGIAFKLNISSFIGMVKRFSAQFPSDFPNRAFHFRLGKLVKLCTYAMALRQSRFAGFSLVHPE